MPGTAREPDGGTLRPSDAERKLSKALAQVESLLRQRETLLGLRKQGTLLKLRKEAWAIFTREGPPEHLPVQQAERERQHVMQLLGSRLLQFGDELLKQQQPSPRQSDASKLLRSLETRHDAMSRDELLLRQKEETRERALPSKVLEAARARRQPVPERLLLWVQRAEEMTDRLRRFRGVPPHGDQTPPLQMPVRSAAPPAHVEKSRPSVPEHAPTPVSPAEAAAQKIIRRDASQMAAMRYQMAQHEAVTMARKLGYSPSALADAIQSYSDPNTAIASVASSCSPSARGDRSGRSAQSQPASPPAMTAKAAPSHPTRRRSR